MAVCVLCVGCGSDLTDCPKSRKNIGKDSKSSDKATRHRILSIWRELALHTDLKEYDLSDNSKLKLCPSCFTDYKNLAHLHDKVSSNLHLAVGKLVGVIAKVPTETDENEEMCVSPAKRPRLGTESYVMIESVSDSPPVMVTVANKSSVKRINLTTPNRRHITKAAARGHKKGVVDHCFVDTKVQGYIIHKVSKILQSEIKAMCSLRVHSILKNESTEMLKSFEWDKLISEVKVYAPLLYQVFLSCTKTRHPKSNQNVIIGMCIAMLLKYRYDRMSMVQKIIGLIMYAGHCGKKVYGRLQKLHVAASHKTTIRLVKALGKDYDSKVKEWMDSFLQDLKSSAEGLSNSTQDSLHVVNNIDIDEFELFESFSESDDCSSASSESESEPEYDIQITSEDEVSDEEPSGVSNDSEAEEQGPGLLQVAQPPEVLEPYTPIQKLLGYQQKHKGFRICGDNIDKNVKARHMRLDNRNQSLHYFHLYAVENRVDFASFSDEPMDNSSLSDMRQVAKSMLPTAGDDAILRRNISTLILRVLCTHLDFFKSSFHGLVDWHIQHRYYQEMSTKSVVVPLGIVLKNEAKSEDMVDILTHTHQYVPSMSYKEMKNISTGENVVIEKERMHPILVGGDQMTAARTRSAKKAKVNAETPSKRLEGIVAAYEDWHTKGNLMGVLWKYLYSSQSSSEHGTLYQLKNSINRTNVVKKPLDSFDACEEFLILVVHCHIIVAAMTMLGMTSLGDTPKAEYAPKGNSTKTLSEPERRKVLNKITDDLLDGYINISYNNPHDNSRDKVQAYAKQVLSSGCFYLEFRDGIKEGDGQRICRCNRYMLPTFHSSGRKNYAIETLNFLLQHDYILSERQAAELIWSRFVNVHGNPGKNIPNDLHCEHLNRLCKTAVKGLGANKTKECITRVAQAIGTISPVLDNFDADSGVDAHSSYHKVRGSQKDMKCIIDILIKEAVFTTTSGRFHPSFKNPRDPLHFKSEKEILDWMETHITL